MQNVSELTEYLLLLEKVYGPIYKENILTSDLQPFDLILTNLNRK